MIKYTKAARKPQIPFGCPSNQISDINTTELIPDGFKFQSVFVADKHSSHLLLDRELTYGLKEEVPEESLKCREARTLKPKS